MLKKMFLSCAVVGLAVFSASAEVKKTSGMLDGKSFVGEVNSGKGAKADPDTFIFADGAMRSTACDQYGFGTGHYSTSSKGKSTSFTATTKSSSGAQIVWSGAVNGDTLHATGTWTMPKEKTQHFTFSGKLGTETQKTSAKS